MIRSSLILKKCANNLKVLHEYIRVCEQFDPSQQGSAASIQQLNKLGVQKSFVLKVIDDVKAFMESTEDLLGGSQLNSPQLSWQITIEDAVQQNLRLHGILEGDAALLNCTTEQLYHVWLERYNENRELYQDVSIE